MHTRHDLPWQPAALGAGALVWALAGLAMWWLDGLLDLSNLALLPVLAAALAALWWPPGLLMAACAAAVLAFNWAFVPPRGSFAVNLHQHALLLLTMLAVSWIVTLLMARQRRLARREREMAQRVQQLQQLANTLRDIDDPRSGAAALQAVLGGLLENPVPGVATVRLLQGALPERDDPGACLQLGPADADQNVGLWLCMRQQRAMGPGTGWHEEQPAWYLPLRGRSSTWGAALLPLQGMPPDAEALRQHAQALCDQMGQAMQRAAALHAESAAREEAQAQRLRNTLLAAISHDHRTPLATILGAASSLHDQGERLPPAQRQRLAARIVDEATQLRRLTDNTLQLARLDTPGLALALDWESVEEIVGSVLQRLRQREPAPRVKARVEPGLPLLRCDAVLLVQLLDNLVDNALKHGGPSAATAAAGEAGASIEILARQVPSASGSALLLAVRDRGPGVPLAWRERVFDTFQRGEAPDAPSKTGASAADGAQAKDSARPGAGVGLALCRAIARAHGGELTLRARGHGGSSFECTLPLAPAPPQPPQEAA